MTLAELRDAVLVALDESGVNKHAEVLINITTDDGAIEAKLASVVAVEVPARSCTACGTHHSGFKRIVLRGIA